MVKRRQLQANKNSVDNLKRVLAVLITALMLLTGAVAGGIPLDDCAFAQNQQLIKASAASWIKQNTGFSAPVADAPAPTPLSTAEYQTLSAGDSGTAVLALKDGLKKLGFFSATVQLSSLYSEETAQAVARFQALQEIEETGIADPYTQALLFAILSDEDAFSAAREKVALDNADSASPTPGPKDDEPSGTAYIGNKNSMVFHRPGCYTLKKMKPSKKN